MKNIAVIGSGISGLSMAQMLNEKHTVTVFEAKDHIGGLVFCDRIEGVLFHRVGGHVFNSRNKAVLDWFWSRFDQEKEFRKATRNAKILLGDKIIGYPIENYLYQLPAELVSNILKDMLGLQGNNKKPEDYPHFEAFLKGNFGDTLYNTYFKPYNHKIWNIDLSTVPLAWLDGKLPMPNLHQMLMSNIIREEEREMVHATFYYPLVDGSQFIVNRLAEGLSINVNSPLQSLERNGDKWMLNGNLSFDEVVFTGDVRKLGAIMAADSSNAEMVSILSTMQNLRSNATSNLLCECDATDISWLYLPEDKFKAHRIIYTGNFAESNNGNSERITCTVEFSGTHTLEFMSEEVSKLPGNMKVLGHNYEPNSYVVQDEDTRAKIAQIKSLSEAQGLYLLGRFGEWEYYNMDKAIEAAMEIVAKMEA